MRSMPDQTCNEIELSCKKCKAKNVEFTFTDDDDLIIKCQCCTTTHLIKRKLK